MWHNHTNGGVVQSKLFTLASHVEWKSLQSVGSVVDGASVTQAVGTSDSFTSQASFGN